MKYFIYLLFLIQFQSCKSDTVSTSIISSNKEIKVDTVNQDGYLINSIDKIAIGKKIEEENKIKQLKITLKNSFEREVVRPYMWDIFISNNDTLLQFYNYKKFIINNVKFKSYYIKIDYEDGNYESILLVNESLSTEYNSMIVYEELESEEKHLRNAQIKGDKIQIILKSPNRSENLDFQVKDGLFLDYFDLPIVNKKFGNKKILNDNEIFEYQLKGNTNNHLKNGYWIEKRYSYEYGKSIIQDGYYINGLRNGDWNFSPEGPVDMIKKFDNGRFISQSYP
ncbi:hypothetical protein SGQ44_17925 [Flavobacterium sp. Fl-77]|uniref:Uncharacterized protein n=1 Tax=Flavobacterium flavipigmentatum TaxID=2893884 RepID=A0AAJ2SHW5_9FLAO|nr:MULTISPECIES: hypothetical protein [unclassified Flavobacterium]MDX6184042.1 hypothetical protein [Flavobacterium sp. Fl-33]MDX6187640.1 hypothetical protein [Flavobacterium sp. Fl-77]UFH39218.1 hypothetical protein LNP22_02815 [Flavobacterium sp. F-70]